MNGSLMMCLDSRSGMCYRQVWDVISFLGIPCRHYLLYVLIDGPMDTLENKQGICSRNGILEGIQQYDQSS